MFIYLNAAGDPVVDKLPPTNIRRKGIYFLKTKPYLEVTPQAFTESVLINEFSEDTLASLALLTKEVYYPILANPANRQGWCTPAQKDVMLKLSSFIAAVSTTLGDSYNQTVLPPPPKEAYDEDNFPEKERLQLLEDNFILWSNKIEAVLNSDPAQLHEEALAAAASAAATPETTEKPESLGGRSANRLFPDPLAEVEFWKAKANNLMSIEQQLASPSLQDALAAMINLRSSLAPQFQTLVQQVMKHREEAAENYRYLAAMTPHFERLKQSHEFAAVVDHFNPLMYCILLTCKNNKSFRSSHRVQVLITEICNSLIASSEACVSGETVFHAINDKSISDAVQALKTAMMVCNKFKAAFFKHQQKARTELPDVFEIPSEVLFARLDSYLTRCSDILEFCKIATEYDKLAKVSIGGSKGAKLSQTIAVIHEDFTRAVKDFECVPYDILDITQPRFDSDFHNFRKQVKQLDGRLAHVLSAAFDDATTIAAQVKLLDSYEGLLERPIIRDELDRKYASLLRAYMQDLLKVQEIFHANHSTPYIAPNMPPVAGAIGWCRSLRTRITEPMDKIRMYTHDRMREETKEVETLYLRTLEQLNQYEKKKVQDWIAEVEQTAADKLQQPLLRRHDHKDRSQPVGQDRLYVNFDDVLVRLLREVKYLLGFGIDVGVRAASIYEKAATYRKQQAELAQITSMYNEVQSTLHPIERPLVDKEIAHVNDFLAKGVNEHNWTSHGVQAFITDATAVTRHLHTIVTTMKNNFADIKKMMADFAKEPLVERKNKPVSPADFDETLRRIAESRYKVLEKYQVIFAQKLEHTKSVLSITNSSTTHWRAYQEYVQDAIREGLQQCIMNSTKFLCDQIGSVEPERSAYGKTLVGQPAPQSAPDKQPIQPLLEIRLTFQANEVVFSADDAPLSADDKLHRSKARRDVWSIVQDWAEGFYEIGSKITRPLDGASFVPDLKKADIISQPSPLKRLTDANMARCEAFRQEEYVRPFEPLWRLDRRNEFNRFLQEALARQAKANAAAAAAAAAAGNGGEMGSEKPAGENDEELGRDSADSIYTILPLADFEERIQYFKQIQAQIMERDGVRDIGFLRINTAPVKQALHALAQRWIETFTTYIYNDVVRKLTAIDSLVQQVTEGVQADVRAGDSEALKRVLGYIHQVRSQEQNTMDMIEPIKRAVALLKEHGRTLDEYEAKLLADAPLKWENIVSTVYKVKEKINVLQNDEVDKIKDKVRAFKEEVVEFYEEFQKEAPFNYDVEVVDAYTDIYLYHTRLNEMEERAAKLADLERVFELAVTNYPELKRIRHENKLLKQVWDAIAVVQCTFADWKKTPWNSIDTDTLSRETAQLRRQLQQLPAEARNWPVFEGVFAEVSNMAVVLPVVSKLHAKEMQPRHWEEVKRATGKQFEKDESFCLANILQLELHNYVDEIDYIEELAKKEAINSANLAKIEAKWETLELQFSSDPKFPNFKQLRRPESVLIALQEHSALLQSMQGQGKYVEHFIDRVTKWLNDLRTVETVLTDWLEVQRKWASLEPIYQGSVDIKQQLPEDALRFDEINTIWIDLMTKIDPVVLALDACNAPGRAELLATLKTGLEQCNKSLNQYLEMKRKVFPRYYFLDNSGLLSQLSAGDNALLVQKYISGCFDNLHHLEFKPMDQLTPEEFEQQPQCYKLAWEEYLQAKAAAEEEQRKLAAQRGDEKSNRSKPSAYHEPEPTSVAMPEVPPSNIAIGMHSKDGDEYVPFFQEFPCTGAVENWLTRLVQRMRETLKEILARAKATADHWEVDKPRTQWLRDYPAQIALTASQIIWTEEVTAQFESFQDGNEQAMREYAKTMNTRLEELIHLVLGDLTPSDRIKIMTLITVDVHNRDVIAKLIEQKITEASAFAWQSQMRYTWEDPLVVGIGVGGLPLLPGSEEYVPKKDEELRECYVRVADCTWPYSYEYIGNTGRLVITPLTDRCYITLTQALRLTMGGAPAGPAGTGKTETTKDLGRAFGLAVNVFNCSPQMNVQSMAAIFKGLAQTGSWGCFDEFNRIDVGVLSVISTQVSQVLNAIRQRATEFDFMGDICRLIPSVGMFITMNPGYAGRTELPENLKALFRSCAMVVPDMDLICENTLMSEGFVNAQRLTKKFIKLYQLCEALLSKQRHYDWGLRASKAVLRVAGHLKRAEPHIKETHILMRALRDFNSPKLVEADKPIFFKIIEDLFPGIRIERKIDQTFHECLRVTAKYKRNLQPDETFLTKCLELRDLMAIRHSVFVVGPASSGKSEIWKTLCDALNDYPLPYQDPSWTTPRFHETVYDVINPKAVTNDELYGYLDKSDWHGGVLSDLMRAMALCEPPYTPEQFYQWIVLDGDIDPMWIESLNTVMDDNKMLTLVSNEHIHLTKPMRLLFEISNLDNATPATVSRAGILYINATDIGAKPYLDSWLDKRSERDRNALLSLFLRYNAPDVMNDLVLPARRIIPVSEISMIRTLCYLLDGLLQSIESRSKGAPVDKELYEATVSFACVWAFGGAIYSDRTNSRAEFSEKWKSQHQLKYPAAGTIFDYYVDEKGKFVPWTNLLPSYAPTPDSYLVTQIFIPTVESVRMSYILDLLIERRGTSALLVGSGGTGKTKLILDYLRRLRERNERRTFATVNINYYTDSKSLQRILEGHLDKRAGRSYGPVGNKRMVYFIDDLNMAQVDKYGTQSCVQLMKQQMDYGFWYDTTKLEKKEIVDIQYLCAMNPYAGSFNVSDRLQGQLPAFAVSMMDTNEVKAIFGQVMRHHFSAFGWSDGMELADLLVKSTVELWDLVMTKFTPSTRKFHYLFTLRDLAAVFQGLSMSQKTGYNQQRLIQLWMHECLRVFSDRLVDDLDIQTFNELLESRVRENFRKYVTVAPELVESRPIFASFVYNTDHPVYLPVDSMDQLKTVLTQKLDQYNENNPVMNLELFQLAMMHICRIARIIENPGGNALLVGVGGSGKQSLCRLASFICQHQVVQLSVNQNYSLHDLRSDFQDFFRKAGQKDTSLVFLLTESQILDDIWLSMVNDFLCSGYIPGLFNDDDLEQILGSLRNEAKAKGIPDNRDSLFEFFISRVRQNLHVVMCVSPVGQHFRSRCRKFPGILNCTVIDWFHVWPTDALVSVAHRFISDLDLGPTPGIHDTIARHMAMVHENVGVYSNRYRVEQRRYNYTTPKSFLELIAYYRKLFNEKRTELARQLERLEQGVRIMKETRKCVEELQVKISAAQVENKERKARSEEAMMNARIEAAKVTEQQIVASREAAEARKAAEFAAKIQAECKRELDNAEPQRISTMEAMKNLDKKMVQEIRDFKNPSSEMYDVLVGVMILTNTPVPKTDIWGGAKLMLKDATGIVNRLIEIGNDPVRHITPEMLKRVEVYTSKPTFTKEFMNTKSKAAGNLCEWVNNVVNYYRVLKDIEPKQQALAVAQQRLEEANQRRAEEDEKVERAKAALRAVEEVQRQRQAELEEVERTLSKLQHDLQLAQRFVDGLASEDERWSRGVADLRTREHTLVGDVMLAASFVSYLGAFDQKYRTEMWQEEWLTDLHRNNVPTTEGVDPLKILANESNFAKWKNEGLAADRTSLENAAIITQGTRWPLLVDPQLQGIRWVRGHCKNLARERLAASGASGQSVAAAGDGLITVRMNQEDYLRKVCMAIRDGHSLLIENCPDTIDATLDPVLARQFITRGTRRYIRVAGEEVPWNDNFRLFLQTKLANPHYRPEIFAQCMLINFIVTESGLEDQLLAIVVDREQPELEEKRTTLVRSINEYMVSLNDLETEILEGLSHASNDILSDSALIESLEKTKAASREITSKVEQSRAQEISINLTRNGFKPVAAEASWIYFLIIQLSVLDHMYQFSLNAFVSFFRKAMDRAEPSPILNERVQNLCSSIRMTIFTWVARGLFEEHKLIFAAQLCFKLMQKGVLSEAYNPLYYDFLLRAHRRSSDAEKPLDWIPKANWECILYLSSLEGFEKLSKDMANSPNRFKEWYLKARPESAPLPLEWRKLDDNSPFMKLMVVRALRQDRMISALETYVRNALPNGKHYVECDAGKSFLDVLAQSLDDSSAANPIFFILSPGADPIQAVEILAKRNGFDQKLHRIALGQGQDIIASQRLDLAAKEGHWVVLENIHLMPVWLKTLEKKLDQFDNPSTRVHPDFRVFLSAQPSEEIPIGILERSVKLTNEPPRGLKQNLKRAFATFEKDTFETNYDTKVKSILFGLCYFHAIIIERTKFGPKGWNRTYPFNTGDLLNSATIVNQYIESAPGGDSLPWKDLRYMIGEIMYGGHITDDWDRETCNTYLKFFLRNELMDEMELYPFSESYPDEHFRAPPVMPYDQYLEYIDYQLQNESPVAFGMHPNEEIAVKTTQANTLFARILELQPSASGGGGGGGSDVAASQARVQLVLEQTLESVKGISFNIEDIAGQFNSDERTPYQNVFLQECERMNILVAEIIRSLRELNLGLSGDLQMSESMEELQKALFLGRVPTTWAALAYPSLNGIANWVANLVQRAGQLQEWTEDSSRIPMVVRIDYLFNPQSFLNAILQDAARAQHLELDKISIVTEVTRKKPEEVDARPRDGAYISGLYLEGARINPNNGTLEECAPREMYFTMPVVQCKAVLTEKMEKNNIYRCPVYKTQQRGPTYVFTATLRTKYPTEKWVLAGAALVMEVAE